MNSTASVEPIDLRASSSVEQAVGELRRLQNAGAHDEVLVRVGPLLESYPRNRDLLLIAAASLRLSLRPGEALEMLDRLDEAHPRFSQARQERGLCYVQLKDAPRAIEALTAAVNLNPALATAWRMLEGVYRIAGDAANAANAATQAAALKALPPEVATATTLFFDGEVTQAERIIRAFLLDHGDHPEAMRLLARIAVVRNVLDDAELLYEAMLTLAPDHRAARCEYGETLVKRQKYAPALEQAERLLAVDPRNLAYRALEASAVVGLGDFDRAIRLYRAMLLDVPQAADFHLWLGHALKTVGRVPEAIEAYRAAVRERPQFGEAYWSLANLKTYRFDDDEIGRMRAGEGSPLASAEDRTHLCFALGKALEDRGETAEAWSWYQRGNALTPCRERLPAGDHRGQHRRAEAGVHQGLLRRAFRLGRSGSGPDLHPRPAALRLDPDRTDPRLPLAGRGHPGTRRDPARGPRA